MKFYGTESSLKGWKSIIENCLGKPCSEIYMENDRACFDANLNFLDRKKLQEEYWYRAEPNAPRDALGERMKWNYRIGFEE